MKAQVGLAFVMAGLAMTFGSVSVAAQKKDRNLITVEEIKEREDIASAHDAVRLLRPQWFKASRSRSNVGTGALGSSRSRSEDNSDAASQAANSERDRMLADEANKRAGPVLYVDEVKQESVEDLKNIRIAEVAEIRYMSGNDASGRYGAGHESGAILLKTNRLKKP